MVGVPRCDAHLVRIQDKESVRPSGSALCDLPPASPWKGSIMMIRSFGDNVGSFGVLLLE